MLKGNLNVAKRPEVKEKLRKNHWSKNPKHSERIKKLIIKKNKGNTYNRGKPSPNKGKTYEEIMGKKKAKQLKKDKSEKRRGIKFSKTTKKRMSKARKGNPKIMGKNNPAYINGECINGGIKYNKKFTEELKTKIRKRDKFVCKICNKNGWIIHHIDYNKKNNNPNNLITLCQKCHGLTGWNRNKWKKFLEK